MLETLKELSRDVTEFQEQYIKAFRWMLLARTAEERISVLWRAGKIAGGVYLGKGQEAVSAALGIMLRPRDIFGPLIRDQAGRLAYGEPLVDMIRTYIGSKFAPMRGRDGNVHRGIPQKGIYPMISHLGALIPVVAGALMARRFQGETEVVGATSIGEGGTSTGAFHEALNLAAVEKLPLVVSVVNNHYAYSTPNERQFACHDLVDRAIGYGVEGYSIDGTDLKECLEVFAHSVQRARSGHGPQMVVSHCVRLTGHAGHDDAAYMDPDLLRGPFGRDCLKVAESYMLEQQWVDQNWFDRARQTARAQVEESVVQAQSEPSPSGEETEWCALSSRRLFDPSPEKNEHRLP
jgi:pyruvate dehydrogenase E1 component alpha subunit/2-oxoisovalerate dehydrogenase E1 component alpha subunit